METPGFIWSAIFPKLDASFEVILTIER